jgi:hypothetical protein
MKNYFILCFLLPSIICAQNIIYKDSIFISEFNINENKTINIRWTSQVYKNNNIISKEYIRTIFKPNDIRVFDLLKDYDDYINLAIEAWKDIPDSLGVFNTNEITDSAQYIGNWRLNIKSQITNGKVKINANNKFIFDPNLNQPRTTNLPLVIKSNLITINVDGVKYLLIKNESGKYISNDNTVRFVKLE